MDFGDIMGGATGGASVLGTAISLGGTLLTNEANRTNAGISREWQGDQERSAREFSERMSSTAHQREVKDLRAAGLNPILSAGGGAASPGGSAPGGATANASDAIGPAIATGLEMARLKKDLTKADSEIALIDSQKKKTDVDAAVSSKGIPQSDIINRIYKIAEPAISKIEKMSQSKAQKSIPNQKNLNFLEKLPGKMP